MVATASQTVAGWEEGETILPGRDSCLELSSPLTFRLGRRARFLFRSFLSSAMSRARSMISAMCWRGFSTPRTSARRSNFSLNFRSAEKRKLKRSGLAGSRILGDSRGTGRGIVACGGAGWGGGGSQAGGGGEGVGGG